METGSKLYQIIDSLPEELFPTLLSIGGTNSAARGI
jgi:hypothetical protein